MGRRVKLLILTHVVASYAFWPIVLCLSRATSRPYSLQEFWSDRLLVLASPGSIFWCLVIVILKIYSYSPYRSWTLPVCVWISYLSPLVPVYRLLNRMLPAAHRPGLCLTCGYDLRATPNRCPECGTVTKKIQRQP